MCLVYFFAPPTTVHSSSNNGLMCYIYAILIPVFLCLLDKWGIFGEKQRTVNLIGCSPITHQISLTLSTSMLFPLFVILARLLLHSPHPPTHLCFRCRIDVDQQVVLVEFVKWISQCEYELNALLTKDYKTKDRAKGRDSQPYKKHNLSAWMNPSWRWGKGL